MSQDSSRENDQKGPSAKSMDSVRAIHAWDQPQAAVPGGRQQKVASAIQHSPLMQAEKILSVITACQGAKSHESTGAQEDGSVSTGLDTQAWGHVFRSWHQCERPGVAIYIYNSST